MKKSTARTRAERRELKNRPRMAVHSRSLKQPNKFAGRKLAGIKLPPAQPQP